MVWPTLGSRMAKEQNRTGQAKDLPGAPETQLKMLSWYMVIILSS